MWGMLYADDAGIASRSPEGLENMLTVIVTNCVCRVRADGIGGQDGDRVPENERWGHVPFTDTAAGQVYKQTVEFVYLGGAISAGRDLRNVEVALRIQTAWAGFGRYRMESMTVRACVYVRRYGC